MQVGIFEEYNKTIDEIKNTLLHLYNKFQGCRFLLESDYKSGAISQKEYDCIKGLSIYSYDDSVDEKYMLSKEEIAYIKLYGAFTSSGELAASMVNKKYLDKQNILNSIGDSIRIFYYYENTSERKRKASFIADVKNFYDEQISACEDEIDKLKRALGEHYYASLNFQKVNGRLTALVNDRNYYLDKANNCNLKEFMAAIGQFYHINSDYYNWYIRRFIKKECENEIEVTDQESEIDKAQGLVSVISDNENDSVKINDEIVEISTLMNTLVGEIISDSLDTQVPRKKIFGRKKENNKEILFTIFTFYMQYPIFVKYLEQFSQDGVVNLNIVFDKYYEKYYNNSSYVDPKAFKNRLLLEVINYLKSTIESLDKRRKEIGTTISSKTKELNDQIDDIKRYEMIRKYYDSNKEIILDVDRVLLDLGFSLPEIDRIYDDMKTYIENNFTKEYLEEPVLNMKVGDYND